MSPPDANQLAELLSVVRKKGVKLWSTEGQLRFRAPHGALSREDLELLKGSKREIVDLLGREPHAPSVPLSGLRGRCERLPLALSQLWRWHLFRLWERPSARVLSCAMRLSGQLNTQILQQSVNAIVRRHDALRTRIVVSDGVPVQEVAEFWHTDLELIDLTEPRGHATEDEITLNLERYLLEPVNLESDSLLGVRLLKTQTKEHVLIVAMEHMISDAFSLCVFVRELLTSYSQLSHGRPVELPDVGIQFSDYSRWLEHCRQSWVDRHAEFWSKRLKEGEHRFPADVQSMQIVTEGWAVAPLHIEADLKQRVQDWAHARRTTLAMAMLTAYAGLVLRWCDKPQVAIQYQTSGRSDEKLENAIGYFASLVCLRIELSSGTFTDLLSHVVSEYCQASERGDLSFVATETSRGLFSRNTIFNWVPCEPMTDGFDLEQSEFGLSSIPIEYTNSIIKTFAWDNDPEIVLYDRPSELRGGVYFPSERFRMSDMQCFARSYKMILESMTSHTEVRMRDIRLRQ